MERAGWAVAGAAIDLGAGYGSRVSVLTGPGNNGGDGWVAARRLAMRGAGVTVHELATPRTEPAVRARSLAVDAGVTVGDMSLPSRAPHIVIDALFGSGLSRDLPDAIIPWLDLDCPWVAAHVPSGLGSPDRARLGSGAPGGSDRRLSLAVSRTRAGRGTGPVRRDRDRRHRPVRRIPVAARRRGLRRPVANSSPTGPQMVGRVGAGRRRIRRDARGGGDDGEERPPIRGRLGRSRGATGPDVIGIAPRPRGVGLLTTCAAGSIRCGRRRARHGRRVRFDPRRTRSSGAARTRCRWAHCGVGRRYRRPGLPDGADPHAGEFSRFTGDDPSHESATDLAAATGAVVVLKGNPTFVCDGGVPWCVDLRRSRARHDRDRRRARRDDRSVARPRYGGRGVGMDCGSSSRRRGW